MSTQEYINKKFNLTSPQPAGVPFEIPNFDRDQLAFLFQELGFNIGAEIGVLGGTYSIQLCKANPKLKLFCIDSWGISEVRKSEFHLRKYEEAKQRLAPYNTTLIRKLSIDAIRDFEYDSLDFVYIDANHKFDYVIEDIIEWTRKVRKNGIIAGHDYAAGSVPGAKEAVDIYTKNHNLNLYVTSGNKNPRSWWFIKP